MSQTCVIRGINDMLGRMKASHFWQERLRGCPPVISDLQELRFFPVLEEEDLRRQSRAMVLIPPGDVGRIVTATSGTTGIPKRIYLSRQDLESTVDYFEAGLRSFCDRGQKILILYPSETQWSVGSMLKEAAEKTGLSVELGDSMEPRNTAKQMELHRWDVMAGTPAQMAGLAVNLAPLPPGERRLKAALSSGASLTESVRRRFAEATGAEIYDHWGCREGGYGGALECHLHRGLHLRPGIWAEVMDESLLITTYGAHGMPLLRYRTGDRARIETSPCECGDSSPRIFPMGRFGEDHWDPLQWEPSLKGWGKRAPSGESGNSVT